MEELQHRAQSAEELVVPYQHQLHRLTAEAEAARVDAKEAARVHHMQEVETEETRARLMKMMQGVEEERATLE